MLTEITTILMSLRALILLLPWLRSSKNLLKFHVLDLLVQLSQLEVLFVLLHQDLVLVKQLIFVFLDFLQDLSKCRLRGLWRTSRPSTGFCRNLFKFAHRQGFCRTCPSALKSFRCGSAETPLSSGTSRCRSPLATFPVLMLLFSEFFFCRISQWSWWRNSLLPELHTTGSSCLNLSFSPF